MKNLLVAVSLIALSSAQAQTPVKKVLMEEFTTVLCGVCPPATYALNQFHEATPNTILITHHEGFGRDSMSNATTQAIYNAFKPTWGSFAPAIMIERTVYPALDSVVPYLSTFTSGYDTLVGNALSEPPIADIQVSSTYDWGAGTLLSTVTATFVDPLPPADYRVNLFLVEDSVTGFGYPGYAQKCYDGNFVALHYPGYPYANDTISGYPHRYVLRQTLAGNPFGTSQTVPVLASGQSPVLNTPYVFTMTAPYLIPAGYNFNRLYLVASVNRHQAGSFTGNEVLNAQQVKLSENISTGIIYHESEVSLNVYPNPANGIINVSFRTEATGNVDLNIKDISGRSVHKESGIYFPKGNNTHTLSHEQLSPGIYVLEITGNLFHATRKVMIR